MNEALALKLLRQIMGWSEETAVEEYRWVRLMASFKYDGYRDYLAGARFPETLAGWLMQFKAEDRAAAYVFVKSKLLYFGPLEIVRLVDQFYPRFVERKLRAAAAAKFDIPSYLVMTQESFRNEFFRELRRTLFIGLSDGARIDMLRRSNAGVLVNDQIVLATHIDEDKWRDLGSKLKENKLFAGEKNPRFDRVWLIDDFTGSGTSFLRPDKKGGWTGKLYKFRQALEKARATMPAVFPLTEDFSLHIHHYISSAQARDAILGRIETVKKELAGDWFANVEVEEGFLLPDSVRMTEETDPEMWKICDDYYDHGLYEQLKEHLDQSKQTHIRHGYGNSALPVVLEHNCPNNAITLLWAETDGSQQSHQMRPLFMRRHRHS